jgi:peptide/nickel transport system permease protein
VFLASNFPDVTYAAFQTTAVVANPGLSMFSQTGKYTVNIALIAVSSANSGHLSVELSNPYLFIYGRQYGLLGTDWQGKDLWSQFAFGARISIEVGIVASLITVGAGALIGLIAGIYLGVTDEFLMRLADIILTIPFVPLAIVVIFVLTQSAILRGSLYFWLIVLFAVLSWPALARIIRAQTLSLKERGFIESARAMGASRWYIVRRHLFPNVLGIVYATLALSVPGFILTEAALDFLLPAASNIPTWGRTIALAYDNAASASLYGFGWWWFLFPGLAIVLLSLAFVLLGYALDSTFNPRLRKR